MLDGRLIRSEEEDLGANSSLERRPHIKRSRILVVFDGSYSARGLAVYSAVRLLIDQLGHALSYDVFCLGAYRGPKFSGMARELGSQTARGLAGAVARVVQRLHRSLVSFHMSESPARWESNLNRDEKKLLRRLFDADNIHAVIVFTTDDGFALRVSRLAHIYSTAETPHLIVVTPNDRIDSRAGADFDWLGVRVFRDGDLVAERNRSTTSGNTDADGKPILSMFSFLSAEEYPRHLTVPCDPIDWPEWLGADHPYPKRVRDVVLFVRPDWMNCGSGTTFKNLALWFQERDALLIDVGIWPYRENFDPSSRETRVAAEHDVMRAALYFAARMSTSVPHFASQISGLLRRFPWTLARQISFQYSLAARPQFMRRAISRAKISHIYINHYFTYGYARELIGDRPFFLDTHDIQTVNFTHCNQPNAITGRVDRFDDSLRDEMEIAGQASRLCFVSPEELDLASRYIDRDRLDYVLPLPKIVPCKPHPLSAPARLLIVASDNQSNVQSIGWFLTHVWPTVLGLCRQQTPPSLRICGSIASVVGDIKLSRVEFLGIVPELRSYYDECDIVVLPIIAGGGVAIKTLEAVLHERATLATRHALRGLPDDVVRAIGYEDDPAQFARSLLEIVGDPERHESQLGRSQRAATLLRQHSFHEVLGKAVDSVCLAPRPHFDKFSTERAGELLACSAR